jgi:hypothetical protein
MVLYVLIFFPNLSVYLVHKDGWTKCFSDDMNTLYYGQYAEEAKSRMSS